MNGPRGFQVNNMADTVPDLTVEQEPLSFQRDMEPGGDNFSLPGEDAENFAHNDADVLKLEDDGEGTSELAGSALESADFEQGDAEDGDGPSINPAEMCPDGVLSEEAIENGLTKLGRNAEGTQQVFLQLSLPGYSLKDIAILSEYIHLQKVELPHNELTDLEVLGNMPYLLDLDVSHNQLSSLLDFKPPKNLQTVNYSFNKVEEMPDLSSHHSLRSLILDNNNIKEIKGLEKLHRLQKLSLAHNRIEKIEGLDGLPIQELSLSGNELKKITNIDSLHHLRSISFCGNKIRSLTGLQDHKFLEIIDVEDNEIIDLSEVQFICDLKLLRSLNLQRNPIRELPDYRLSILFHVGQLTELDHRRVDVEEKVAASNMFNPSMEVIASRDHVMHVVYSFLQPSRVLDSTLPSVETPYPILVLVGPQGAGKKDLALKLVDEFPDYFGYGVPHTTRKPILGEEQGKDFNFVSLEEFEATIKLGKFLQTYSYQGEIYGITIDAIEAVAREGLACVTQMELEGVLTLRNTYFEPRYVMLVPLSQDAHEKRLRERDVYSETQIEKTLARADLYTEHNRDHPGFFDMVINTDDIIEAYKKLRHLVMDYLGISGQTPSVSDFEPSNTELNLLEKEATNDTINHTAGNSAHIARTWSKPSLSESANQQTMLNMKTKLQSPKPQTGRGIVEEESLRRRQSAAKEAVTGGHPTIYDQVLQSAPRTVPEQMACTLGLDEFSPKDKTSQKRSYSAPTHNMDALPPTSPDSSESRSGGDSSLSNISEARDIEEEQRSQPGSRQQTPQTSKENLNLPAEAFDRITLMSDSASKNRSAGSVPMAPRPVSGEIHGLGANQGSRPTSGRPGSERHPVLPPIGQSQEY